MTVTVSISLKYSVFKIIINFLGLREPTQLINREKQT